MRLSEVVFLDTGMGILPAKSLLSLPIIHPEDLFLDAIATAKTILIDWANTIFSRLSTTNTFIKRIKNHKKINS